MPLLLYSSSYKLIRSAVQDKPAEFVLTDDMGGHKSTVTISAKYVPVPITLEMRETVNSMSDIRIVRIIAKVYKHTDTGVLRVDLLEGSGLKSADRNGKVDPYCSFSLNGTKVHKSSVQKKTLTPKWNEVRLPFRLAKTEAKRHFSFLALRDDNSFARVSSLRD